MTLPEYRKVIFENIPAKLKVHKIWVVWEPKIIPGRSKPSKVPISLQINENTGIKEVKPASCNDPRTWMTFEDAVKLLKSKKRYKGLSIALSPEPPQAGEKRLIGIDIDKAVGYDGFIKSEFLEAIKSFNTYAEFSPTIEEGGLRAFCYGSFPINEGVHRGNIEVYQYGKFLTITGHILNDFPLTIEDAQEAITIFRSKYFKPFSEIDETSLPVSSVKFTDEQLFAHLSSYELSNQFKDLFYHGAKPGDDHSVKDKDLCKLLVFWTQDPDQIDRIFRQSALLRPEKWDKVHFSNGDTYGQGTIKYALKTRTTVYNPATSNNPKERDNFFISLYPFTVNESGIYKTEYKYSRYWDPEKQEIQLSSTPCVITAIGENIDNGEILYKLKIKDNKHREKIIWKTTSDLMLKEKVKKLLKEGMHFKEADANKLIDYFDKSITSSKNNLPSGFAASSSGWKNDFSLFVVGNRGITADGEIEVLQYENPTAELYAQKGELKEWVKATNKLIKYPAVRFKLYTACVPPLLKLLNVKSFVETQQTPSGRLKTTMGWHAASIWGNPEKLQLNAESTAVGIIKTVEYCTDLPIFVDETSITDKIKDLVYLVANGVGRSKGNTDGGLVMPSTWSTVLLTTGEKPILPESALTGQQVRVLPLRDGVKDKLPALEVKEIQNAITQNYGHVGTLFLQELFKEKDNLGSLFNSFFKDFPEVEDITSDRAKEYYAAVALAGYLLERVFENIGVITESSIKICKDYFNENVISNSFMPDHIKALSAAYAWFSANEVYFQDEDLEHPINHERYGWIRDDKVHGSCVCFIPDKLSKHLNTEIGPNTYEAATDEWKALGILIPKEQANKTGAVTRLKKNQISVNGIKKQVIKIPFSQFEKYLKLDKEEGKTGPERSNQDNKPQVLKKQTALKVSSTSAKVVTSIDDLEKEVTITTQEEPPDNIILFEDDALAAEVLRQEGVL